MWQPNQLKENTAHPRTRVRSISVKTLLGTISLFLAAILALLPRLNLPYFNGKYLWAEDGIIYINQARSLSLDSLFKPYAGYLQTYPRLIALVGNFFPLKEIPDIYIGGWFLAVIITIYVIRSGFGSHEKNNIGILLAIVAILLQPNIGEIFFNNVNTQWFVGLALVIYLIIPGKSSQSKTGVIGSFIASISGPFSIIYFPIVLYKVFFEKRSKEFWLVYCAVVLGAIVQAYWILSSPRAALHDFSYVYAVKIFLDVFAFNAHGVWVVGILFFWVTFCIYFVRSEKKEQVVAALFILAGCGVWAASIYSSSGDLSNIAGAVVGRWGDRYTFIPYSTFILAYLAVLRNNYLEYFLFSACLIPFFYSQVVPVSSSLGTVNTEFNSYAEFSRYADNIVIPTNPMWPTYPGWHINGALYYNGTEHYNHKIMNFNEAMILQKNGQTEVLGLSRVCSKSDYIGIESFIFHNAPGWIDAAATSTGGKVSSFSRFYPAGYVKTQFAFPNDNVISLSMSNRKNNINKILIYCPELRDTIKNREFNPMVSIYIPVTSSSNTPLPLVDGQKVIINFLIQKQQLSHPVLISSVSVFQGNYGNTADGKLAIELCTKKDCNKGSRALTQSEDNSFFSIPLKTPLRVYPNETLTLKVTHIGGNKPDALWVWPEEPKYPQKVVGPSGVLPGKAIRIRLKYKLQEQK